MNICLLENIERHTRHLKKYGEKLKNSIIVDYATAINDDLQRLIMGYGTNDIKGINPNGRVLDYKRISYNQEIGLIQDPVTLVFLWRYYDKKKDISKDYNENLCEDVWEFEQYLHEQEVIYCE